MGQLAKRRSVLEKVGPDNLATCGIGCLTNPKHIGHPAKLAWLERRFAEGLRYLLCRDLKGKPLAFLEYVPGEYAWRPVDATGWLFVHCLWVYPSGQKVGGLGTRLIRACLDEARDAGAIGVAAMVSDGTWMASKHVFLKNDFEEIDATDRFELVIHRLKQGPAPRFRDISKNLSQYKGLHVVYTAQCPMLPKSVSDLKEMAAEHGLDLQVSVLDSPQKAQQRAPSYYGVYSLVWNGKLLSDHYVSKGRFRGILRKEILQHGA
ncbi:MAG: GNAT family N-acetyltransferase [Gemmatimonadota bacterium]|nr:GNAT family N-acetyltransferase [Gemmatimonadota bacterium]